jgi:hypothetical protein
MSRDRVIVLSCFVFFACGAKIDIKSAVSPKIPSQQNKSAPSSPHSETPSSPHSETPSSPHSVYSVPRPSVSPVGNHCSPMVERSVPPKPRTIPAGAERLVFSAPQTAGISGFREFWDRPVVVAETGPINQIDKGANGKGPSAVWDPSQRNNGNLPGAIVADAVHRSLLVRFPGAALGIAKKINAGFQIVGANVVLKYKGYELWAEGYTLPAGMSFLGEQWLKGKPKWHLVGYALRKPWIADRNLGPTYNSSIHGKVFWTGYGACDVKMDRFPKKLGPVEVSAEATTGQLDVSDLLISSEFGEKIEDRLRVVEQQGLIIKKEEVYDASFWGGGYEWATSTGGRGILLGTPELEVYFVPGVSPNSVAEKGFAIDIDAEVTKAQAAGLTRTPTAQMPSLGEIQKWATQFSFQKQPWMSDWQWQRSQELVTHHKATKKGSHFVFPNTLEAFQSWMDSKLGDTPRKWKGWSTSYDLSQYFKYGAIWPAPVRLNVEMDWYSWLMPDKPYAGLVQGYTAGQAAQDYFNKTQDWSGNFSVYRTYMRSQGPMNFNVFATIGGLLGGAAIKSQSMVDEGRNALESWLLRHWTWNAGATQESGDHYYLGLSLKNLKTFASFGPEHVDRLMGQITLQKSVDELADLYHPGLKRFITPSGRTVVSYLLATSEAPNYIIHTLSRKGAITDLGVGTVGNNIPTAGHDTLPGEIADSTQDGPWAPSWLSHIVDEKQLPFQTRSRTWNNHGVRTSYLGRHYGLASEDNASNHTVPFMAQWKRSIIDASSMKDLGLMLARHGVNRTEFIHANGGYVPLQGGSTNTFQDKNRAIILMSPFKNLDFANANKPESISSIQASLSFFNYEEKPTYQIYVNGKLLENFPANISASSKIIIKDGVSYIGIIPIAATNLGRDIEIQIAKDVVETSWGNGGSAKIVEAFRIHSFMYKGSNLPANIMGSDLLDNAYAGFAVEMGDESDSEGFLGFQNRISGATVHNVWNETQKRAQVRLNVGAESMEVEFVPSATTAGGTASSAAFPVRKTNGVAFSFPSDLFRDSHYSQQSSSGVIHKGGATLQLEPGAMGYLQAIPERDIFLGMNPFSSFRPFVFTIPNGRVIKTNGRIGIFKAIYDGEANVISLDYGFKSDQKSGFANEFQLIGFTSRPKIFVNGEEVAGQDSTCGEFSCTTVSLMNK